MLAWEAPESTYGGGRRLPRPLELPTSAAATTTFDTTRTADRSHSISTAAPSRRHPAAQSRAPCSSSSSGSPRSLAFLLRVFLCGCGVLYMLLLWHNRGLWTAGNHSGDALTTSTTPIQASIASIQHQQHGAQKISTFTPQTKPLDPCLVHTESPAPPRQSRTELPTQPILHPLASTTYTPSVTTGAITTATAPPSPSAVPAQEADLVNIDWMLSLLITPPPTAAAMTDGGIITYEEHMTRIHSLEDNRIQSLAMIGMLQNKLHTVRDQLERHASIIADVDAKSVLELPRAYTQQLGGKQRKFKCLGWRATADCDPNGKRTVRDDRTCLESVPAKMAGYCEIQDTTTRERFRVMKTSCDTLRWDATLRCFDAWHFANFARQSLEVLQNATLVQHQHALKTVQPVTKTNGIVLVVYPKMLPSAYATLRTLRRLQCTLPVEIWYSTSEMDDATAHSHPILRKMATEYGPLVLRAIDDPQVTGFTTKIHAIRHSGSNVSLRVARVQATGALFWPDFWHPDHTIFALHERSLVWEYLGLPFVDAFEQESGQLVVDRTRTSTQKAMALVDFYAHHKPNLLTKFKIVHGDKDLFRLAWLKSNTSFYMVDRPPAIAGNVRGDMFCGQSMVQFDPHGEVLFLHRNANKLQGRSTQEPGGKRQGDLVIWTHLLQLKPTSSRGNYTVEIYQGSSQFPKGQWCYGKPTPATPHFNTLRFADLPFRDVEKEIRAYALEASDLVLHAAIEEIQSIP